MKVKLTKIQPSCWRNSLETGSLTGLLAGSLMMILPLFFVALSFNLGTAQGGCACNDVVNLSLNPTIPNGVTAITRDMILEAPGQCPDNYVRILFNGEVLIMNSGKVSDHPLGLPGVYFQFNLSCRQNLPTGGSAFMCGKTLYAEVLNAAGAVTCWGQINVEDKTPPNCTILPVEIPCDNGDDPDSIADYLSSIGQSSFARARVSASDNCFIDAAATTYETVIDHRNPCGVGYFIRRWTVTDNCGNTSTCEQTIYTFDQEAPDITWPCDILLTCEDDDDLSPDALSNYDGTDPYYSDCTYGYPVADDNCSNFAYHYTDWEFVQCEDACYKILREWEVLDWCNYNPIYGSGIWSHTQVIKIVDLEAPTGTSNIDVIGTSHTDCDFDVHINTPDLEDNCSPTDDLGWSASVYGPVPSNFDPCAVTSLDDVPSNVLNRLVTPGTPNWYTFHANDDCGEYLVIYHLTDCCKNSSYMFDCFEVYDDIPPVAICDQNSQLTLTYGPNPATSPGDHADGWATICWQSLDDGSYDNCEVKDIRISKGENGPWRECLTFGCDEKGDNKVYLRVRDQKNNESKCWVNVLVEDKAPPMVTPPDDAKVVCGDDISPDALGYPTVKDECYFDWEWEDAEDLYCGGTIDRTWTITDWSDNVATHVQRITVNLPDWTCVTPNDTEVDCADYANTNPTVGETGDMVVIRVPGDTCNILAIEGPNDTRVPVQDTDDEKIFREWVVHDWCRGTSTSYVQKIVLKGCVDSGPIASSMVTGSVSTELDLSVDGVDVTLSGVATTVTQNGLYGFYNLPNDNTYALTPSKNDNHGAGVSTIDVIKVRKHLLGLQTFNSPYKMLAADVNADGKITSFDMVQMRQLILNQIDEFPSNSSWIFVDESYVFQNPANPFAERPADSKNIFLTEDVTNADFIGVKVGDLNGDAADLVSAYNRDADDLVLQLEDVAVERGNEYTVEFKASDFANIIGYQFSIDFDQNALEFVNVTAGSLPELSIANFGLKYASQGVITTSWDNISGVDLDNDAVLFSITFRANSSAQLSNVLAATSSKTRNEAYNTNDDLFNVTFDFATSTQTADFVLYQNKPNPFTGETLIGFNLPEAGAATLTVMDIAGKTLFNVNGDYNKGYNEISINSADLSTAGVLYYELTTVNQKATKKMILMK